MSDETTSTAATDPGAEKPGAPLRRLLGNEVRSSAETLREGAQTGTDYGTLDQLLAQVVAGDNRRLWYTVGLPGSGKSSWAGQMQDLAIRFNRRLIYLNKDTLRATNPTFHEKRIHALQTADLQAALATGDNIVVDNTHLNARNVRELEQMAETAGYDIHPVSFEDVPVVECIRRDRHRQSRGERFVGASVIKLMAMKYGLIPRPAPDKRPPAVVFDLDGTLANNTQRLHFIKDKPKDWQAWYAAIETDTPVPHVTDLYQMVVCWRDAHPEEDLRILFLSGRAEDQGRVHTEAWLEAHGFTHADLLIMRRQPPHIPDFEVKESLYKTYVEPFYRVKWVVDDRQQVVDAWRNVLGIPVFQAAPGNF